jgi:hypothetical protein
MTKILDPIQILRTKLAALNACTDNAWVLAFDNGLGVKLSTELHDPRCSACCITLASEVATDDMPEEAWAYTPIIINGANEQAKVRRRQEVIAEERGRIEQALDYVNTFNLEKPFRMEADIALAQAGAS